MLGYGMRHKVVTKNILGNFLYTYQAGFYRKIVKVKRKLMSIVRTFDGEFRTLCSNVVNIKHLVNF